MRKLIPLVIFIVSMCLLAGCGDEADTGGQGGDGGTLNAAEYWDDLYLHRISARCETVFNDCPNRAEALAGADFYAEARSEQECISSRLNRLSRVIMSGETIQSLVDQGQVEFDRQMAQSCLNGLRARRITDTCWVPTQGEPAECDQVLRGLVENGEPCLSSMACRGGSCESQQSETDVCYGTCVSRNYVAEGEPCEWTDYCIDGFTCATDSEGARTCMELRSREEGAFCSRMGVCESGLVCNDNRCARVELVAQGQPCVNQDSYLVCEPGLTCADELGAEDATCIPVVGPDEACEVTSQCPSHQYCHAEDAKCVPLPGPGESCEEIPRGCRADSYCALDENDEFICQTIEGEQCELP